MVNYTSNPPDAAALMTSARSFGNYDLAGAIADLIDNSINAKARNVEITCVFGDDGMPEVRVRDDGHGMTRAELHAAMRPASRNPLDERSPDDLGRFGWGLKSASFSQCRRLTVLSVRNSEVSGACWDLDDLDEWKMGVLNADEVASLASRVLLDHGGTEIVWNKCDRLSEGGTIGHASFNELVVHTGNKLALIFHRYLSGTGRRGKLGLLVNGTPLRPVDPFHRNHEATQALEQETLRVERGESIVIQPYILPHHSKLRQRELESLSGEEGLVKNQGFYIYRNDRLIMYGTWFRLLRHGELSQLVRVSVDIPNTLDDIWKITVDKSDAQLPGMLRSRLRQIVSRLKGRSSRVYRSKGGRIDGSGAVSPVWNRYFRKGEIRYEINRAHPLVEALVADADEAAVEALLRAVEREFPVEKLMEDGSREPESINQSESNPAAFREFLDASIPMLLRNVGGDVNLLVERMRSTEPYRTNWSMVKAYLDEEGWTNA